MGPIQGHEKEMIRLCIKMVSLILLAKRKMGTSCQKGDPYLTTRTSVPFTVTLFVWLIYSNVSEGRKQLSSRIEIQKNISLYFYRYHTRVKALQSTSHELEFMVQIFVDTESRGLFYTLYFWTAFFHFECL